MHRFSHSRQSGNRPLLQKGRLVGKADQSSNRNDVLCYTESQIAENNQSVKEPSPD